MGPRSGQPGRLLVQEHGNFHSADRYGDIAEVEWIHRWETAAAFLPAVYALLHHSKLRENGAVDLGQHQGAVLLVARIRALSRFVAGVALATWSNSTCSRGGALCRRHSCGRARRGGNCSAGRNEVRSI